MRKCAPLTICKSKLQLPAAVVRRGRQIQVAPRSGMSTKPELRCGEMGPCRAWSPWPLYFSTREDIREYEIHGDVSSVRVELHSVADGPGAA